MEGLAIRIRGVVQGVGFRPYIWHLAHQYNITGSVWNDSDGVMIHAFANTPQMQNFLDRIPENLPPLAVIHKVEIEILPQQQTPEVFVISSSEHNAAMQMPVTADAAVCQQCLADMTNPANRRYRYPFTNCTHCGPRLSIVRRMPYDRENTSMAGFAMCKACEQEYQNPANRRFHAQANCCPTCGPTVWMETQGGKRIDVDDAIMAVAACLQEGNIAAIKGLGGFHLACDATNPQAVKRLRTRKLRYAKPFALMALDIDMVKRYARVDQAALNALTDKSAPIVLLPGQGETLAAGIADDDQYIGFMLAYTPLHYVLMEAVNRPLVMTSGNLSEQPQCIDNQQAREQLGEVADVFLMHDREIVNRLDDSVIRITKAGVQMLRRARGDAPKAIMLPAGFEQADSIAALGGELKNTFCLIKQGQAIVSPHVGDLEDALTQQDFRQKLVLFQQLYDFTPDTLAVDMHPGYLSTQHGLDWMKREGLTGHQVQHHHAHIAACMAEHGVSIDSSPVLGVVFDGVGMGLNGELWGGEFLLADYRQCHRLTSLQPIALPGGAQAMREPWRNTLAQLHHYFDIEHIAGEFANLPFFQLVQHKPLDVLIKMIDQNINSPWCSSAGRLFDAVAGLLGIYSERISYEGQAAMALENLAAEAFSSQQTYQHAFSRENGLISSKPLWHAMLTDLAARLAAPVIAARFHHSVIEMIVSVVKALRDEHDIHQVVLSGGVFQNQLLLTEVSEQLSAKRFHVMMAHQFPLNDGGISLGQAMIAAAKKIKFAEV